MKEWSLELLQAVLDAAPEGIVVCEPEGDHDVVYVNRAFVQLTGYAVEELRGRNLRMLQGAEREQEGRRQLQEALASGGSARITLRNFRKDGSAFWNEMLVQAIRAADGRLLCFVGHHRDVSERMQGAERPMAGLPSWMREDRLTGLASRAYFDEVLRRDWAIASREQHVLALALFDVDQLGAYNDTFGRAGGDAVLRRVARLVSASFRRGSDLVARREGGTLAVLVHGTDTTRISDYGSLITQRIREQLIHHPRSLARYVTVSAGVATLAPGPGRSAEILMQAAERALARAKREGRNRLAIAQEEDFAAAADPPAGER